MKYRAYNTKLKKMAQVLAIELDPEFGGVYVWGKASVDFETGEHDAERDFWTWDDCVEMQCTGLKDKVGKEIYECDILLYLHAITLVDQHTWPHKEIAIPASDHTLKVYWEEGAFKLFDLATEKWLLLAVSNLKEMTIIGNIYEHPHLLERQ